ncbi:MAG: translation initiation factor IF-6 [Candidatus Micrarchaeia archaeon]
MSINTLTIHGDDFIGAYCITSDNIAITGSILKKKDEELFEKTLKLKPKRLTIGGSDLIGLFSKANKNGILISNNIYNSELKQFKLEYPNLNIGVLDSELNAIGNNILINDKLAIVNPDYKDKDIKIIEEIFGVEAIKLEIAGYKTVGSHNILTNKGLVANNNISEDEFDNLKKFSKSVSQSTANLGSLAIGISVIANSNGILFGSSTSGYEMANIQDGLEIS